MSVFKNKRRASALVYVLVTIAVASALLLAGLQSLSIATRQRQAYDDSRAALRIAEAGIGRALRESGEEYPAIYGSNGELVERWHGSDSGASGCEGTGTATSTAQVSFTGFLQNCEVVSVAKRRYIRVEPTASVRFTTRDFIPGVAQDIVVRSGTRSSTSTLGIMSLSFDGDGASAVSGFSLSIASNGFSISPPVGTTYTLTPNGNPQSATITITATYTGTGHAPLMRLNALTTPFWVRSPNESISVEGRAPSGATLRLLRHYYPFNRSVPNDTTPVPAVVTRRAPSYAIDPATGRCSGRVAVGGVDAATYGPDDCPYGD